MQLLSRTYQSELMDGENYSFNEYKECLEQIAWINTVTRGYQPTLGALTRLATFAPRGRPLQILDVGFGRGDMLGEVAKWARRHRFAVKLTGVDLNPWSVEVAQKAARFEDEITFRCADVFSLKETNGEKFDIVINSLMMHHLKDEEIVRLLRWMTQHAHLGWVINDLHRHPVPYYLTRTLTKVLPCNRLIRADAPLSVARSFRKRDWERYISEAELRASCITVHWHWSFRYIISYQALPHEFD